MTSALLRQPPAVVNIGLADFAGALRAQAVPVVHVRWTPPPVLDPKVSKLLDLMG